jgi:hypothetical protein
METVEKTTTAIAEPVIAEQDAAVHDDGPGSSTQTRADPWAALMQTGITLLEQLAGASWTPSSEPGRDELGFVQRDPGTGQDYLRIPMPSAEVLDGALTTLAEMLARFKR